MRLILVNGKRASRMTHRCGIMLAWRRPVAALYCFVDASWP